MSPKVTVASRQYLESIFPELPKLKGFDCESSYTGTHKQREILLQSPCSAEEGPQCGLCYSRELPCHLQGHCIRDS